MKNDFLLAICRAGYYSTNYGVEPCEKCPQGTYQEMEQQTQCHSCPSGTHTKDLGSTSLDDCICKFARKPLNITSRKAREVVFQARTHNKYRAGSRDKIRKQLASLEKSKLPAVFTCQLLRFSRGRKTSHLYP